MIVAASLLALSKLRPGVRLVASAAALVTLALTIGTAATHLTPAGDELARVAPASGFWLMAFAFALLATDALTRLRLAPLARVATLILVAVAFGLLRPRGVSTVSRS